MSLEAWGVAFAGLTAFVLGAAAIAGIIQLRHLRASNHLAAFLSIMEQWGTPSFQQWYNVVLHDIAPKSSDPQYLRIFEKRVDRSEHPEMLVCDFWEQIGAFLKHGLVDEPTLLDIAGSQAQTVWQVMQPAIGVMRRRAGPAAYENFEFLAARAAIWERKYPDGNYPSNVPRMADLAKQKPPQPADA